MKKLGIGESDFKSLIEGECYFVDKSAFIAEVINEHNKVILAFYLVITGRVKLVRTSYEGKEQILHLFGPGEIFCLIGLLPDQDCPGNFIALENSRLFVIPARQFRELVLSQPLLMLKILAVLSYKLKLAMDKIAFFHC